MTHTRRPALERFIDAMQIAAGQEIDTHDLTSAGLRHVLEKLIAAAPVARSIVILANPLAGPGSDLVDAYTARAAEQADAEPHDRSDPDGANRRAVAEADALYLLGVCVGLQLGDNV